MKPIYLDYAATTPLDPAVLKAMLPYFGISLPATRYPLPANFGNPGSMHSFGQRASAAIFESRQTIAQALNCHYSDIIFTGSATEANNLVLKSFSDSQVITSSIEHDSVLKSAPKARRVSVSKSGLLDLSELEKNLKNNTELVSIIYANNETGTVQDIVSINQIIKKKNPGTLLHIDAVQALQYLNCKPEELGVDMMTLSAHKIYGPKGVGLLYANKKAREKLIPLITGGGQENGLRSGTENTAGIVGFARAVELVEKNRAQETIRMKILRDYLWAEIKKLFPKAQLNGPILATGYPLPATCWARLPNILNFYTPELNAEEAIITLDLADIAISAGPACSARTLDPSHVLLAMGQSPQRAKNSLRISLGKFTTQTDLRKFMTIFDKLKNQVQH